jgi:hypothetical protein
MEVRFHPANGLDRPIARGSLPTRLAGRVRKRSRSLDGSVDRGLLLAIPGSMRLFGAASLLGIALFLAGCVTPSIPIPPPDPTKMTFHLSIVGTQSQAVFTYAPTSAYVGATGYVYDRDRGQGVIQAAAPDGSIGPTVPFPAAMGDNVFVTVQIGEHTDSTCIVLQEGQQDPTVYCP